MSTAPDDDLPCTRVVMILTDYLEGALPADESRRLEEHFDECDGCTVVLEQFRTTIEVTGTLSTDDVDALDAHTRSELLGVFRQWAAQRPQ